MASVLLAERPAVSEVDAGLKPADQRVGEPAGAAGADDVLQVGLEEERGSAESEAVAQLDRDLVALHAHGGIQRPRAPLRVLQVIAEATVGDTDARDVRRA